MNVKKAASAEELDRMFDNGEDMADYFDWSSARRPGLEAKRVNVDFPQWMMARLDARPSAAG